MIPVVLGILIALFIDNLNQSYKNRKFVKEIKTSIIKELQENRKTINFIRETQIRMIDTIEHYTNNQNITIQEIIVKGKGFKSPTIKNTSWNAIINSKIELMDYKTISMLSDIDGEKQILNSKTEKLADFIYLNLNSTGITEKKVLKTWILDVMDSENTLLKSCNQFLDEHVENE